MDLQFCRILFHLLVQFLKLHILILCYSLMLVTALAPKIGYDNAASIAKKALKNNTKLKDEALKTGLINEKEYDNIVNPIKMIGPN